DPGCIYCSADPICLPNETLWWSRAGRAAKLDNQLHFGFSTPAEDQVRDRILEALEFAAESGKQPPRLQPPRPEHDDGEVLVVQTAGAQIGERRDQLTVSVKGQDVRKLPGQQGGAIYCCAAIRLVAH